VIEILCSPGVRPETASRLLLFWTKPENVL
jgi:hypothetical protein